MAAINWKVIDPSTGNITGHWSQVVPELDVCTLIENSAIDGLYANSEHAALEVDGVTTDKRFAPVIYTDEQQNNFYNIADFLPTFDTPLTNGIKRFKNAKDIDEPVSAVVDWDRLVDIATHNYPDRDSKKFVMSTNGYEIYVDSVVQTGSVNIDYDVQGNPTTIPYYSVKLRFDDVFGNKISHVWLASTPMDEWYGSTVHGWKTELWVCLFCINNFNPKQYSVYETPQSSSGTGYKNGSIYTGSDTLDDQTGLPCFVPAMALIPTEGYCNYYYQGAYHTMLLEMYNNPTDDNLIDFVSKRIFTDKGLLQYYTTAFNLDLSEYSINWRAQFDDTITIDNQQCSANIYGLHVFVPIKKLLNSYEDGIGVHTAAYNKNETPERPDPGTGEDPTSDIPTSRDEYNPGGTFNGYQQIDSEKNDGSNDWSLQAMNNNHPVQFSNYVGSAQVIQDLVDRLFSINADVDKAIWSLASEWQPSDVIFRILEFPFDVNHIFSAGDFIDAAPCHPVSGHALTREKTTLSGTLADYYVSATLGLTGLSYEEAISDFKPVIEQIIPGSRIIPNVGNIVYYKRSSKRWIEINYGTRTIQRIMGNSLDYTDTTYILNLPQGDSIELNPNILFRRSDGIKYNTCELSIKGILDIESGDMLFSITANGDMICQRSINVATERTIYGHDGVAQWRAIAGVLGKVAATGASVFLHTKIPTAEIKTGEGYRTAAFQGREDVTYNDSGNVESVSRNVNTVKLPMKKPPTEYYSNAPKFEVLNVAKEIINPSNYRGSYVSVPASNSSNSTKQISNQIPYLDIYFPDTAIPEDWRELRGLNSMTNKVGSGYNRYGIIDSIVDNGLMLNEEKAALSSVLVGGFYL